MKRSTSGILTTHAGGLARPKALRKLAGRGQADGASQEAVRAAVAEAVKQQAEAGVGVISDGDQGAALGVAGYVASRLGGFEVSDADLLDPGSRREQIAFPDFFARAYPGKSASGVGAVCVGPVTWAGEAPVRRDIENLKAAAGGVAAEELFMAAPSPSAVARAQENAFYTSDEECEAAIAEALRGEYRAIVDAGFVLQVELPWSGTVSRLIRDVELLNYALEAIPADRVRVLLSFGRDEGPRSCDPELRDIVHAVLRAKPAGLGLVAANGRHEAEWRVWSDVKLPEGKVLIPGVIDSTTSIVEHPRTIAERIMRFASLVGRENVIAGVDSGFDPSHGLYAEYRVTRDVMWAKLRSLVQGAELATRELWPAHAAAKAS